MNNNFLNKIVHDNALKIMDELEPNSIDMVLTDPPYFLDKMDNNWDDGTVSKTDNQYTVKSLPAGMKFDREHGIKLYEWYLEVAKKIKNILKPGGFFYSFSSPRLYHRMACAVDDTGLLLRDCFMWLYTQNQPKAMSLNHFIDKMDVDEKVKEKIKNELEGWKTPKVKSCFEPIMMAQKKQEETYLNNMLKHEVGLFNTKVKVGQNMFPANVMTIEGGHNILDKYFLVSKPNKEEKGEYNNHKTVKPLAICEYLIKLSVFSDNAIILDPFVGSGTTALAAKKLGKNYIGIDTNEEYVKIARERLGEITEEDSSEKEER